MNLSTAVVSEKSGDIPLPDDEVPLEAVLVEMMWKIAHLEK